MLRNNDSTMLEIIITNYHTSVMITSRGKFPRLKDASERGQLNTN
jgi:hypothetical protein